jgi:hypothetical protein
MAALWMRTRSELRSSKRFGFAATNAIALVPGNLAARLRPATVLRAE